MEKIKVGDVVCLKSDKSVKMTVGYLNTEYDRASCCWFVEGKAVWEEFYYDMLENVTDNDIK